MKKTIGTLLFILAFFTLPLITKAQTEFDLSATLKFTGENNSDYAGDKLSTAGDVNGDGYDDILISSYKNDSGGADAGTVYLIYGSTGLDDDIGLSSANVKIIGEEAGDYAGFAVSSAGDINSDGFSDILIGAYLNDSGGADAGAAYIIYGSSSLNSTIDLSAANVKLIGEDADDYAGHSVSSAGDINNDNYDDIIIGANKDDQNGADAGAAYIIYGSSSLNSSIDLSAANVKIVGQSSYDWAGWYVSSASNINHDSFDDVLISAGGDDDGGTNAGAVYIIYGSNSLNPSIGLFQADVKMIGEDANDMVGEAISSAGDVNNDNYDDVIIGAQYNGNSGAAYIIYGSSSLNSTIDLSAANIKVTGEMATDYAGYSVSSAGDVNNDNYDDILIGAYQNYNSNGSDAGAAYIIFGASALSSSFNLSLADVKLIGEDSTNYAGSSVFSVGDVNNDNYDDVLVGARNYHEANNYYGAAYLGFLYKDTDGDGVKSPSGLFSGTDCNDLDATISALQTYYIDSDQDGFGSAATGAICSLIPTVGYSLNNTDCNDADITINSNQTYYQDSDGDGYGSITTASVCQLIPPAGYVTNSTDCSDTDATVNTNQTYYQDLDGDGLGSTITTSVCSSTAPAGYVSNSTDLDDTIKDISTIAGTINGDILITYINNDIATIDVFSYTTTKNTIISQHENQYYLALSANGKKIALVDVYSQIVISSKTLSKKQKYSTNTLKLKTIRSKDAIVIISKNNSKILLSALTIKTDHTKLISKDKVKTTNKNIKPSKTKIKKNTIYLRNKKVKTQEKYLVTKKFNLIKN